METKLTNEQRTLSKEANVDVIEIQPGPPTKRCKRKLTNAIQPVDDVQM